MTHKPRPKAICIEDIQADGDAGKYTQCVALVGSQRGLRLDQQGRLLWQDERPSLCQLWVSADDRLVLLRPAGAAPAELSRGGRALLVPEGKPVVLLDRDELALGARRLRVHIHGATEVAAPPRPFIPQHQPRSAARRAATALALGAAVSLGGIGAASGGVIEEHKNPPPIEVRDDPPDMAEPEPPKKPNKKAKTVKKTKKTKKTKKAKTVKKTKPVKKAKTVKKTTKKK